ncbi:U3 small nucleolar RNA-associated protein 19 [Candida albicans L26]|uniref:CBF/Mak21 family protein n=2 Tax=Candida albicans TaxID=5476 RepID=A0A8H6BSB9_CANAX|nr:CBF/Mak21 family protein [Candida albicans]KGQ89264.1 U3 small nucleolar RNA-associated protein 19 [Candida albicans P94015]KGR13714.1 U3 small nucleolar RNA-associated protein 19 [Candida albicans P78048]KGR21074.1 U3 small nucleolar RNA-associated protein 19 [Candida albicans P37037]KGT70914.1 U3 small nucleolar RNA-associated protein 19 [Candida albicans 12C]KGU15519.1 U3 small nucleolar RNA-associated protein 19 [Candida albicans L26]KGU28797.1 U3 small nucleolar RNA-associated protein
MAPKRKSVKGGVEPKNKKVKTAIHQKEPNTLLSLEELTNLSKEIDESLKFNNLVPLLEQFKLIKTKLIESIDPDVESTARKLSLLLYRNFNKINDEIISNGNGVKSSASEDKKMIIKWLSEKYTTFKDIIYGFIEDKLAGSTSLQLDLLDIILNFIRLESQRKSSTSQVVFFPTQSYKSLTESILNSKNGEISFDGTTDNFIVLEFLDKFQKYWDLQFYFFNNLSEVLNEWKQEKSEKDLQLIFANFLTVLRKGLLFNEKTLEEEPLWIAPNKEGKLPSSLYKHTLFKSQFQKSVIAMLSYPLLQEQYKSVLMILHKRIIPYMSQPQSLMDFLTDCYDLTDDLIVPILALNSLYELMKNYNLEYPDFYSKLYSLLTPELLYTKYRSRFFRLCDLFLSSTHLSANLVASFIKKLARISLAASASGVVIIIPFIYNLLKRHPTCMIMLHKEDTESGYQDPFNSEEKNPLHTEAIKSSLWELDTLMTHYHPNVATLAKIFGEPFRKPSYNMEDFLDWSYNSLLQSEYDRKFKDKNSALEFEEFDKVLDTSNSDSKSSLLEGWTLV